MKLEVESTNFVNEPTDSIANLGFITDPVKFGMCIGMGLYTYQAISSILSSHFILLLCDDNPSIVSIVL